MTNLAIFGIIAMVIVAIVLQHVSNYLFRLSSKANIRDDAEGLFALISQVASLGLLFTAIMQATKHF